MRRALSYLAVFALGVAVALLAAHLLADDAAPGAPPEPPPEAAARPDAGGGTVRIEVLRPSEELVRAFRDGGWPTATRREPSPALEAAPGAAPQPTAAADPERPPAPAARPVSAAPFPVTWTPGATPDARRRLTVSGRVVWVGPAPGARTTTDRDREVCGDSVPNDDLVVADGRVAGVVVRIQGGARVPGAALTGYAPPAPAALESRGCRFTPHIQLAPGSRTLTLTNPDAPGRAVAAFAGGREQQQRLVPAGGSAELPLVAGLNEIRDSTEPWMRAVVYTGTDTWLTLTGADGAFEFTDVDPRRGGELVLEHVNPDFRQTFQLESWTGGGQGGRLDITAAFP